MLKVLVIIMALLSPYSGAFANNQIAVFAGGCFWCMEAVFEGIPGVINATSGFTGGHTDKPTYEAVSNGGTGHAEAVQVEYDPAVISYQQLLELFWHNIDPLDANGQFCDHGDSYRSEIFYTTPEQKTQAEASKAELESGKFKGQVIATQITRFEKFTPAEEYHQKYHFKNPVRYKFYRWNCGRPQRLKELWG